VQFAVEEAEDRKYDSLEDYSNILGMFSIHHLAGSLFNLIIIILQRILREGINAEMRVLAL
jgi:hypothetical protein